MPSKDAIAQCVNRYLELVANGTADEILTLYAGDPTVEDPAGSNVRRGRDAVHEFYAAIQDVKKQTELIELRVCGSEAAFLWRLTLDAETRSSISPISLMTFDADAKIVSMRAFWSPSDVQLG